MLTEFQTKIAYERPTPAEWDALPPTVQAECEQRLWFAMGSLVAMAQEETAHHTEDLQIGVACYISTFPQDTDYEEDYAYTLSSGGIKLDPVPDPDNPDGKHLLRCITVSGGTSFDGCGAFAVYRNPVTGTLEWYC